MPGEMGTLIDEKADPVDVTATLVDLAVRGWLRIEEVPRSNPNKKAKDWTLVQLKNRDGTLLPFEDSCSGDLRRPHVGAALGPADHVRASMGKVQTGSTTRSPRRLVPGQPALGPLGLEGRRHRARRPRRAARRSSRSTPPTSAAACWCRSPSAIVGHRVALLCNAAPARTADGTAVLAQSLGFRRYLATAEANQLRFEEGEDIFSRYLPTRSCSAWPTAGPRVQRARRRRGVLSRSPAGTSAATTRARTSTGPRRSRRRSTGSSHRHRVDLRPDARLVRRLRVQRWRVLRRRRRRRWGRGLVRLVSMTLPVMPPVDPMLSKSVPEDTRPGKLYEPKWDGFRAIVFRDGDSVEIGSRNTKPMQRYFPEVVEAVLAHLPPRCVVDGEIIVPSSAAHGLDFEALLQRVHPAESRVKLLSSRRRLVRAVRPAGAGRRGPDGRAVRRAPAAARGGAAGRGPPVYLTPATADRDVAREWFSQFEGAGLDGIVAKTLERSVRARQADHAEDQARADRRLRRRRATGRTSPAPTPSGRCCWGCTTPTGVLHPSGVAASFPMARRKELVTELAPLVIRLEDHPWDYAAPLARTPARGGGQPVVGGQGPVVRAAASRRGWCEVAYDHMEGDRFRHTAQFRRWRPDRDPGVVHLSPSSRSRCRTRCRTCWPRASVSAARPRCRPVSAGRSPACRPRE